MKFKNLNNIFGWVAFAVAAVTYFITVEPTSSFWDCGEFIATANKLQVPHPPGAPFFLLVGRMFAMLAGGDVTKVAYFVNLISVITSAFSILFLFWTISLVARKLIGKKAEELANAEIVMVLGASLVGSLAYTFTDSFWFSAVEAEVYGMSSFFTAIVVWAAFKWELIEDESASNRWILFIAYLIGLSIGVHLLNLVALPILALIYYFKKTNKISIKGGIYAFLAGLAILVLINSFVIPGIPSMAQGFELLFVNTLGLPFNSGGLFFIVLLIALLVWGLIYTQKKNKVEANTALLALTMILIGYASYAMILVRSNYNPPINENDPSNLLNYVYYLKREQYGSRSLSYGPVFTSRAISAKQGKALYKRGNGKYEIYKYEQDYEWEPGSKMLFPRVWSADPNHVKLYQNMLNLPEGKKPSFGDNLEFFFKHQVGHMYFRYFMWNFAGRESDIEGAYWTTPLTDNKDIPKDLANNKGRSNYFWIPFLLGLAGFVFQFMRKDKDWLINLLLFGITGIGLVVFLNSPPVEPRERDYIYVGSFYFYCIWIGLGVMAIATGLKKLLGQGVAAPALATVLSLSAPVLLLKDNFKNHDRSERVHQIDFAKNLLNSCAPNSILFTGGDNDTFILWYVQEVENFRTDVRICNLSLLGTHWYIDQMKRKTYESDPLPISLSSANYLEGINSYLQHYPSNDESIKAGIDLKEYMKLVEANSPGVVVQTQSGDQVTTYPTQNFFLTYDIDAVKKSGIVDAKIQPNLNGVVNWSLGGRENLMKPDLIMLDIIANNNWKRPIYFSGTLSNENYLNLKEYMQFEGYVYRLLPARVEGARDGYTNADLTYKNLVTNGKYRKLDDPSVYHDTETYLKVPIITARYGFLRLADQYNREGNKAKCEEVLDYCNKVMPDNSIPYDNIIANFPTFYFDMGKTEKGLKIADILTTRADEWLSYYAKNPNAGSDRDKQVQQYILQMMTEVTEQYKLTEPNKKYAALLAKHVGG